jgi:hypothetical protein
MPRLGGTRVPDLVNIRHNNITVFGHLAKQRNQSSALASLGENVRLAVVSLLRTSTRDGIKII